MQILDTGHFHLWKAFISNLIYFYYCRSFATSAQFLLQQHVNNKAILCNLWSSLGLPSACSWNEARFPATGEVMVAISIAWQPLAQAG